jgi:ATP-dependent NAD(P)H-hydrate dehydratase
LVEPESNESKKKRNWKGNKKNHLGSSIINKDRIRETRMHWTLQSATLRHLFVSRGNSKLSQLSSTLLLLATTVPFSSCEAAWTPNSSAYDHRSAFLYPFFSKNPRHMMTLSSANAGNEISYTSPSSSYCWEDKREEAMKRCVIPLSSTSYKGSSGRVGILGGSARYTGAPYYAAMASLKVGADLSFVFCAEEAAVPIKSYSPELMVAPVYSAKEFDRLSLINTQGEELEQYIQPMVQMVTSVMEKLHCLVIGPGLGRCPIVLQATARIIKEAQNRQVPLVLDADALYLLTLKPYHDVLSSTSPVILTPNSMERKRLEGLEQKFLDHCIVIEKGQFDDIKHGSGTKSLVCGEVGGLKRSGGLGDLLAGTLGTLVAWNGILISQGLISSRDLPLSCWTACCFVKRATRRAFDVHRRSMTAPDVLDQLGTVIDEMTNQ